MHILVIKDGEPLPIDGDGQPLGRLGMRIKQLIKLGHSVTWISSSYDPKKHKHRLQSTQTIHFHEKLTLAVLHTGEHNLHANELKRKHHVWRFSFSLRRYLKTYTKTPDLIICGYPDVEPCVVAKWAARNYKVPLIIDVTKNCFALKKKNLSVFLRPFYPLYRAFERWCYKGVMTNASALITETPQLLKKLNLTINRQTPLDTHSWNTSHLKVTEASVTLEWCKQHNLYEDDVILTYSGVLDESIISLESVISVIKTLSETHPRLKLVINGEGKDNSTYKKWSNNHPSIIFFHHLKNTSIDALYKLSTFGLIPFRNYPGNQVSLPKVASDYFTYGLPILSSLEGVVYDLIYGQNIGTSFKEDQRSTLKDCLKTYFDHPSMLKIQKENVKQLMENELNTASLCKDYVSVCETVAAECCHPDNIFKR